MTTSPPPSASLPIPVPVTPSLMLTPSTPNHDEEAVQKAGEGDASASKSVPKSEEGESAIAGSTQSRRAPSLSDLTAAIRLHHPERFNSHSSTISEEQVVATPNQSPPRPIPSPEPSSTESTPRSRFAATLSSATLLRKKSQSSLDSTSGSSKKGSKKAPPMPSLEAIGAALEARRSSGSDKEKEKEGRGIEGEKEGKLVQTPVASKPESDKDKDKNDHRTQPSQATTNATINDESYFPPISNILSPPTNSHSDTPSKGPSATLHPLQHTWTFYHHTPPPSDSPSGFNSPKWNQGGGGGGGASFKANLKEVGRASSVEEFAKVYMGLKKPTEMEMCGSVYIFKDGIMPLWELAANSGGGKWTLNLSVSATTGKGAGREDMIDRCWNYLVLGLIGEELDEGDQLCGAVLSKRSPTATRIQLWTRRLTPIETLNNVGLTLLRLLELENEQEGISLTFVPHNALSGGGSGGGARPAKMMAMIGNSYMKINKPLLSMSTAGAGGSTGGSGERGDAITPGGGPQSQLNEGGSNIHQQQHPPPPLNNSNPPQNQNQRPQHFIGNRSQNQEWRKPSIPVVNGTADGGEGGGGGSSGVLSEVRRAGRW